MLYLTCWCRKRPSNIAQSLDTDVSFFPLPLAASYSGPSDMPEIKPIRQPRKVSGKSLQRRSRQNLRADYSSTIPIRQPETPAPRAAFRLASSAPSTYSPLNGPAPMNPSAAFAKMQKGGFKPRQTPARSMMNAAAAAAKEAEEAERARVRKDRSESTTPKPTGPSSALSNRLKDMTNRPAVGDANRGKKVKV